MTNETCDCGVLLVDHVMSRDLGLVTISCNGESWCLRAKDGRFIANDRMEPEDAILVRDLEWAACLANENEHNKNRVSELELDVTKLRKNLADIQITLINRPSRHVTMTLEEENEILRRQVEALGEVEARYIARANAFAEETLDLRKKLEAAYSETQDLLEEYECERDDCCALAEQRDELAKKLHDVEANCSEYTAMYHAKCQAHDKLRQRVAQLESLIKQTPSVDALQRMQAANAKAARMEEKLADCEEKLAATEKDAASYRRGLEAAKTLVRVSDTIHAAQSTAYEQHGRKHADRELDAERETNARLTEENERLEQQVISYRTISSQAEATIRELKGAMQADDERLAAAAKKIGLDYTSCDLPDDMANKILDLLTRCSDLRYELKDLKTKR